MSNNPKENMDHDPSKQRFFRPYLDTVYWERLHQYLDSETTPEERAVLIWSMATTTLSVVSKENTVIPAQQWSKALSGMDYPVLHDDRNLYIISFVPHRDAYLKEACIRAGLHAWHRIGKSDFIEQLDTLADKIRTGREKLYTSQGRLVPYPLPGIEPRYDNMTERAFDNTLVCLVFMRKFDPMKLWKELEEIEIELRRIKTSRQDNLLTEHFKKSIF